MRRGKPLLGQSKLAVIVLFDRVKVFPSATKSERTPPPGGAFLRSKSPCASLKPSVMRVCGITQRPARMQPCGEGTKRPRQIVPATHPPRSSLPPKLKKRPSCPHTRLHATLMYTWIARPLTRWSADVRCSPLAQPPPPPARPFPAAPLQPHPLQNKKFTGSWSRSSHRSKKRYKSVAWQRLQQGHRVPSFPLRAITLQVSRSTPWPALLAAPHARWRD